MEHRNSTVLTNSASLAGSPRLLLATAAHEFFHVWNVERIRPRTLEPFDLESANTSGELWLAEGVTTYYEKLVMHRAGLSTLQETLQEWSAVLNQVLGSPARQFRSAEDMSRMAPLVDGPRTLDRHELELHLPELLRSRRRPGARPGSRNCASTPAGQRSLDDFMRAMWVHHGRPGGSPLGNGRGALHHRRRARTAGGGGGRWGVRRVLSRALRAGSRVSRTSPACSHPRGFASGKLLPGRASIGPVPLERRGSRLRIAAPVAPGTPLYEAGVAEDDEILSVAGHELTGPDVLAREIQQRTPGDRLALRVLPRGASAPRTVEVTLVEDARVEIAAVESMAEALTPEERRFRESWLSTRVSPSSSR